MSAEMNWDGLLAAWKKAGHLEGDAEQRIRERLNAPLTEASPWYIQLLVGASAWLAAILFVVFLVVLDFLREDWEYTVIGLLLIGAAIWLSRRPPHVFLDQLALAGSITGQISFLIGIGEGAEELLRVWIPLFVLQCLFIAVYRDSTHKVLSAITAVLALLGIAYETAPALAQGITLIVALALVWGWIHEATWLAGKRETKWRPVAYGLAIGLLLLLGFSVVPDWVKMGPWWVSTLGLGAALLLSAHELFKREQLAWSSPPGILIGVGILLLAGVTWPAPGILGAMLILVLGFARSNRIMISLGMLALPLFIIYFYYYLELTLLVKSILLMATGGVLLALRWGLGRMGQSLEEPA